MCSQTIGSGKAFFALVTTNSSCLFVNGFLVTAHITLSGKGLFSNITIEHFE